MRFCLLAWIATAACGGSPANDPAPSVPVASIVAPRAGETDLIVAQVNGRPVWGSCVATQVARGAADRKAALEECVEFELLAQAAEQRGLATDTAVLEAQRTAMVNTFVATEFEARHQKPADLGPTLESVLDKNAWRMHRPDLRASTYVRAIVPPNAAPDLEAKAKRLADTIAAELDTETGLLPPHVREVANRHAAGTGIEIQSQDIAQTPKGGKYEQPYLDALFSIPEVGRVSAPVRTKRGWDVILWSGGLPPKESTREELAHEVFPELRRAQFSVWVNQLIKSTGVTITIDPANVALLDEAAP